MNYYTNSILNQADSKIKKDLKKGDQFILKDLFPLVDWNKFSKKDRILAGTLFLSAVKDGQISNVKALGKTRANAQLYEVIQDEMR